jgi:hypothetical protein
MEEEGRQKENKHTEEMMYGSAGEDRGECHKDAIHSVS